MTSPHWSSQGLDVSACCRVPYGAWLSPRRPAVLQGVGRPPETQGTMWDQPCELRLVCGPGGAVLPLVAHPGSFPTGMRGRGLPGPPGSHGSDLSVMMQGEVSAVLGRLCHLVPHERSSQSTHLASVTECPPWTPGVSLPPPQGVPVLTMFPLCLEPATPVLSVFACGRGPLRHLPGSTHTSYLLWTHPARVA